MVFTYSVDERDDLTRNNLLFIVSIIEENNSILTNTTLSQVLLHWLLASCYLHTIDLRSLISSAAYLLNQVKRRRNDIIKDIKAYFQPNQRPIAARFVSKIYSILARIVVPSYASIDSIIQEVLSLQTASSSHIELLRRIHRIEDYQTRLNAIYQGRKVDELYNFITEQKNCVFVYLNSETREHLLHYAINDDFIECTTLVCIHVQDCCAANQRNIYGDNCYHLAARQLKIKHLALLLKLKCMDIAVLNSNQQSALQLLVISLRNVHFGTTVNIASIAYDAEYMYDLVDRMAARYETLRQFLAADRYGLDVFDYTISTRNIRLICLIMCKIEQLAAQESLDFDWSKYLRHAVLLDSATITGVLAKQYLKSATSSVLTCADFLCLAIHEEKGHALHALLNITEFGQAINTKASNFETINFNNTRMKSVTPPASPSKQEYIPLHHALLKFSCLHEVEPSSRQVGSMELYHENILRTLLRYGADPYTPLAPHRIDNTFALAVDHGCINSVRILLLAAVTAAGKQSVAHIRCYPNGDKFYFHAKKYHSNPLWSCIKPRKMGSLLMLNDYKMLEYLLLHTPFKVLINLVSRSGKTPLVVAGMCNRGDLVQLLVHHGANYYVKIDSFNTVHLRNDTSNPSKVNEYREIPAMTPVLGATSKTDTSLRTTITNLSRRKEVFYAVPFLCSKDPTISSFLFLIYQILKLFDPLLSKIKWIKSYLHHHRLLRILLHALDPRVTHSAEMTSKLYICILNALKVADTRYYVWMRSNVVLPVMFVEWCKELNNLLDSNGKNDQNILLKEWVYTPHYSYPISDLLDSVEDTHINEYVVKQQPEAVYHNHRIPVIPTSKRDVRYHYWYDYVVDKKWKLVHQHLDMVLRYDYHHLEELITCAVVDRQDDVVIGITASGAVIGRYNNHILAAIRMYSSRLFCHLLLCSCFDYSSSSFWATLRAALPDTVQGITGRVGPLHTSLFQLQSSENGDFSRSIAEDFAVIQGMIDLGLAYAARSHSDNTAIIKECLEYADTNQYLRSHDMEQLFHTSPCDSFRDSVLLPFLEYIVTHSHSYLLFRHVIPIIVASYQQVDLLQLAVKHNNLVVLKCHRAATETPPLTTPPTSKAQVVLEKLQHSHYLHHNYCERINDAIAMIEGHELFTDILELVSVLLIHHDHLQSKPVEVTHLLNNLVSLASVDATVASGLNSLFLDSNLLALHHLVNIHTIPFQLVVNLLLYINYYNVVYNKELLKGVSLLTALVRAGAKMQVAEPYQGMFKNMSRMAQVIIRLLDHKELLEKYCFTLQSTGLYNSRSKAMSETVQVQQPDHLDAVRYYVDKLYHLDADDNVDIIDKIITINIHGDALLDQFDVLRGELQENSTLLRRAFDYYQIKLPTPQIPELLLPFMCTSFIDIVLLLENKVVTTLLAILITETSYNQIMSTNCGVRLHYAYIIARLWFLHTSVVEATATSEVALEYNNPEYQQAISLLLTEIRGQMSDNIRYNSAETARYRRFYSAITSLLAANNKTTRGLVESLDMRNMHVFFEVKRSYQGGVDAWRQQLFAKAVSVGNRMNLQALITAISSNRVDWLDNVVLTAAITGCAAPPAIVESTASSLGYWTPSTTESYCNRKSLLEYVYIVIKSSISSVSKFVVRATPNVLSPVEYAALGGYWSLVKLLLASTKETDISHDSVEALVLHAAILQHNQTMVNCVMSMAAPVLRSYLLSTRSFQAQVNHHDVIPHEKKRESKWRAQLSSSSMFTQATSAFLGTVLLPTTASVVVFNHSIAHDALMCHNISVMRNIFVSLTDLLLSEDSIDLHVAGLVHYACYFNHHEVLDMLLSPPWSLEEQIEELVELPFTQVGVYHFTRYRWTPLHVAAYRGNVACLKLLLRSVLSRDSTTPLVTQLLLRDSYKVATYFKHQQCAIELFKALHQLSNSASMFNVLQLNSGDHLADIAFLGMDCLLEYILSYMCHESLPVLPAAALRDLFTRLIQVQRFSCAIVIYRYIRTFNARAGVAVIPPPAVDLRLFNRCVDEFYRFLRDILQCTLLSKSDINNARIQPSDESKESETRVVKRQDTIDAIINRLRKALPSRPDRDLSKLKQSLQRSPQREKKL